MTKRFFDLFIAFFALVIFSPVICLLFYLVWRKHGSPVLFSQVRPGLHAKPFKMYKFRTMTNQVDKDGNLLTDAQRLTPFGNWLRSTSLDELPELWNVLKGEMSLVGPRPLLMEYIPLYSEKQYQRHLVRPGITGWAQINGRNNLSWQEKFALDVWYVQNKSIFLDFKILIKTVVKVFKREDINAAEEATMPKFSGN